MSYFHMGTPTLSSALSGFTSEFEMGSGGTRSLCSPGTNLLLAHQTDLRFPGFVRMTTETTLIYSFLRTHPGYVLFFTFSIQSTSL